jgi:hypothetical protein
MVDDIDKEILVRETVGRTAARGAMTPPCGWRCR